MLNIKHYQRKFMTEFIEMYKSYPTLWDVNSSEYSDREAKREAYGKLVRKLRQIEPDCTRLDVIKKINSLRSAFRREYRKMTMMKACGKNYKPTLWYYNLISFTVKKDKEAELLHESDKDQQPIPSSTPSDPLDIVSVKSEDDDYLFVGDVSSETDENTVVKHDEPTPNCINDEFDAVGYNVASKLRSMGRNQRIIAERVIAETLFQGQMGTLSIHTTTSEFLPQCDDSINNASSCFQ